MFLFAKDMDIRNTFEKVTSRLIISKINFDSFFWRVINLEFDLGILTLSCLCQKMMFRHLNFVSASISACWSMIQFVLMLISLEI